MLFILSFSLLSLLYTLHLIYQNHTYLSVSKNILLNFVHNDKLKKVTPNKHDKLFCYVLKKKNSKERDLDECFTHKIHLQSNGIIIF